MVCLHRLPISNQNSTEIKQQSNKASLDLHCKKLSVNTHRIGCICYPEITVSYHVILSNRTEQLRWQQMSCKASVRGLHLVSGWMKKLRNGLQEKLVGVIVLRLHARVYILTPTLYCVLVESQWVVERRQVLHRHAKSDSYRKLLLG